MHSVVKLCMFFLLIVLLSFNLSSQTVTTVMGYPVIDLSALEPLGAVLSSSEASARRTEMNNQTPSNDKFLSVGVAVSGENGTWNAKMSRRYQVMGSDANSGSSLNWVAAYTFCKDYASEGGKKGEWRLPTQNEFYMIFVLHSQLKSSSNFSAFSAFTYWSATESSAPYAWYVNFSSGSMNTSTKTNSNKVRCVRDL